MAYRWKRFSTKGSHDVSSRGEKSKKILGLEKITENTIDKLELNTEFNELSMMVRSQLRRSIKLYIE